MTDTNKILLLFLWLIAAIIMAGVAVTSGGDPTVTGLALVCWGGWIFAFYNTIVVSLKAEEEAEKRRQLKPQLDAKRDADCIERQRQNGLPTQEALQEIADKFGFTLHGEMEVKNGKYENARIDMETHKSLIQLKEMGINTYLDIFGEYFFFFDYSALMHGYENYIDENFNTKTRRSKNNISFYFTYKKRYNDNINIKPKDFIIQIIEKENVYIVYRKSSITVRNNIGELTENEKQFILTAKNKKEDGVRNGGFYYFDDINPYSGTIVGSYCVSPDNPLILN